MDTPPTNKHEDLADRLGMSEEELREMGRKAVDALFWTTVRNSAVLAVLIIGAGFVWRFFTS